MTNLYVSGSNLLNYCDLSSSSPLVNAYKIENNFKKVRDAVGLYLTNDNKLYSDINCTNLIDVDVEDIYSNYKAYFKQGTLYIFRNNSWIAFQDQIKEVLQVFNYYPEGVVYNDFNNKTHFRSFAGNYNVVWSVYFKEFLYLRNSANYCYGLTEDGVLYGNKSPEYGLRVTEITGVEHLLPITSYSTTYDHYPWVIINGKVAELSQYTYSSTYKPSIRNANVLNMEDDEYIINYLPKTDYFFRRFASSSACQYIITTNKNTYINTPYTFFNGVDSKYIIDIDGSNFNDLYPGVPFFASTSLIEFNIDIYKRDGITLETSVLTLPVNATTITVQNNEAILSLHSVVDTNINVYYPIEKPKGFAFSGFTTVKDSVNVEIPIGTQITLIGQNTALYPVYLPALPDDAVPANLYFMSCETNKIDKTNYLTLDKTIIGVFRNTVDILRPHLIIQLKEYPEFNYVYLPRFKRYYFVTSKSNVSKDIYDIGLEVDPLYTYKDIIGSNYAILSRTSNEDLQSPNLVDGKLPLENKDNVVVIESTQADVFNVDNSQWNNVYRYILTAFSGKPLEPVNTQH